MKATKSEDTPHDYLTTLAEEALNAIIKSDPEVKIVVMLQKDDDGGLGMYGYGGMAEAMTDIFMHLSAVFETEGKSLTIMSEDGVVLLGKDGT